MRKNFRPHAKQNKIASSFRKKTIDPGVDLNLKKDDDNLENIDEYWNMAEYVMDEDQDLSREKNIPKEAKALFNKKSNKKEIVDNVESSVLNDVMDISTEGSKMTSDSKQTPNKKESETPKKKECETPKKRESRTPKKKESETPKKKESETPKKRNNKQTKKNNKQLKPENEESEDTLFDINNIRESLSHSTFKKLSNVSNTSGFDTNLEVGSINEVEKNTNKMGMQRSKSKQKKVDEKKAKNKRKEAKSNVTNSKTKDSINRNAKRRSSVATMTNYKGEPLMGKNNKVYGMTKISTLFQGKSKLEPLITKKSLESGILFLKEGASILQETADYPFTLFLLKGTVEISINNELYKLDRDSCMFVDIGSSYNIVDKSRGGSSLFITFKAK